MPTGAYGRYSTDEQRPTSIEDQFRNCNTVAARENLTIDERLRFSDEAITGKAEGTAKRGGYRRLLDAIEAGECTVLIADELSRITRHYSEGARLIDIVETTGLRVITGDGIDTTREGWKLLWMMKLMGAVQEVDNSSSRTSRGMLGALHRGYQVAPAPYGYRSAREAIGGSKLTGARWSIYPPEAIVVQSIFRMRRDGMSLVRIAGELTGNGTLPPRHKSCKGEPYWRAGTVFRLLSNPIYRGVFIWNNSSFIKVRARKRRKTIVPQEFERESLRLVSDDDWYACNQRNSTRDDQPPRAPRGGGKHLFSGLVRCGDCGALLCVAGGPKSFSLYCPQCATSVSIGGKASWIGYSSVAAARNALEFALQQLFSGEVLEDFHRRLKDRLLEGPAREVQEMREKASKIEASVTRLKKLIANPELGPELFEADLIKANDELRVVNNRLTVAQGQVSRLTPEVLAAQLTIEPLGMLNAILSGELEVYKVRATLRRLLARFELVARPNSGCSVFRIEFIPGVTLAELTETPVIDTSTFAFEVIVSTGKKRPVEWTVSGIRV
ncbi:MAG: recombinase family protein [Rhodoferax sp.]|nr:recombinase family protein [Rhodoferax sp.]